jgi:chaperonin GroEL (HSP60 family)
LKTEDAINSSRLALKDGVVEGGGVCLAKIHMPSTEVGLILSMALKSPLAQNLKNMNLDLPNWGDEVVDAASVVKNAVRNAVSLAGTILTTGIVITLPPKKPEQNVKLPF